MNREILKMHVFYLSFFTIITGIVLLMLYGSITSILLGIEELRMGDVFYFSGAVFFSFILGSLRSGVRIFFALSSNEGISGYTHAKST